MKTTAVPLQLTELQQDAADAMRAEHGRHATDLWEEARLAGSSRASIGENVIQLDPFNFEERTNLYRPTLDELGYPEQPCSVGTPHGTLTFSRYDGEKIAIEWHPNVIAPARSSHQSKVNENPLIKIISDPEKRLPSFDALMLEITSTAVLGDTQHPLKGALFTKLGKTFLLHRMVGIRLAKDFFTLNLARNAGLQDIEIVEGAIVVMKAVDGPLRLQQVIMRDSRIRFSTPTKTIDTTRFKELRKIVLADKKYTATTTTKLFEKLESFRVAA